MKFIHTLIVIGLVFNFYSCNESKKSAEGGTDTNEKTGATAVEENKEAETMQINMDPVKNNVPVFNEKHADKFVENAKKYFEDMVEATQKGDHEKAVELQLKSTEIDEEYQKVKVMLTTEQQKKLTDWYEKLVAAAVN